MHILTSEDHLMLLYILIYVQEPSKINLRPLCREVQFFFSWPGVGLTNRPPVRDSDPGPPLHYLVIGHARQSTCHQPLTSTLSPPCRDVFPNERAGMHQIRYARSLCFSWSIVY